MSSKRKLHLPNKSSPSKKRKLNNTSVTATTPKEMKIKLQTQLNENKIKLCDNTFLKLLQAFCSDGDGDDETIPNVRKQTISYLLKKTTFSSEKSKNNLLKINKIFGNKEESKKLENNHMQNVWSSLQKKHLTKSKLKKSHPSIKLLGCVSFYYGYKFAQISKELEYFFNREQIRIKANFSFCIGISQKTLLDTLTKIKYINNINVNYSFANSIICDMVGDERIEFHINVKGKKDNDNDKKWTNYGSNVKIRCNDELWTKGKDEKCGAKTVCKNSQLLKNYMVRWKQLYQIVEIIIDEYCNVANESGSIKLFKSALYFSDFFGDHPPCSMQKE